MHSKQQSQAGNFTWLFKEYYIQPRIIATLKQNAIKGSMFPDNVCILFTVKVRIDVRTQS